MLLKDVLRWPAVSEDDMGHLGFNKAQFLHFSAPAEPQGWLWRCCLGCESQVPMLGLGFGLFPWGWALPSCSFQTHSREIRPKKAWKGKRHEKKDKETKNLKISLKSPPSPHLPSFSAWFGVDGFGGRSVFPQCCSGAEPGPSPRALQPAGLRWLHPQPLGLGWAGQSPGQAPVTLGKVHAALARTGLAEPRARASCRGQANADTGAFDCV